MIGVVVTVAAVTATTAVVYKTANGCEYKNER